MKKLLLLVFFTVLGFSQETYKYYSGIKKIQIENISTTLFYPTNEISKNIKIGPFKLDVSVNSKIADGKFPLVVFSHGSGASSLSYRTLAINLAKAGFIVAIPLHPNNNFRNNKDVGTLKNYENRPKHIIKVTNFLTNNNGVSSFIDKNRIFLIGHSVGGYTALVVANGVADMSNIIEFCKSNQEITDPYCLGVKSNKIKPIKIETKENLNLKGLVLLAPLGVVFKDKNSLSKIKVPVLLYQASKDKELSEPYNVQRIKKNLKIKNLRYKVIKNAGHYSFISAYPKSMQKEVGEVAIDPKGFDRVKFQSTLSKEIIDFLEKIN